MSRGPFDDASEQVLHVSATTSSGHHPADPARPRRDWAEIALFAAGCASFAFAAAVSRRLGMQLLATAVTGSVVFVVQSMRPLSMVSIHAILGMSFFALLAMAADGNAVLAAPFGVVFGLVSSLFPRRVRVFLLAFFSLLAFREGLASRFFASFASVRDIAFGGWAILATFVVAIVVAIASPSKPIADSCASTTSPD